MIHVDRSIPAPTILTGAKAAAERRRAEAFFAGLAKATTSVRGVPATATQPGAGRGAKRGAKRVAAGEAARGAQSSKGKFAFALYRHDEVKALLHQLFSGKCAYCESRYAATQPMDVEHFRPKSEVADFDGSPSLGYYWLASEWTNLLPSCIDCNRRRNHRQEPGGSVVALGKETLFPIAPGTRRAAFGESLDVERPLLLDPCRDRPEEYLAFANGVAKPSDGVSAPADASARVEACVRVYGLNRVELVQERRRVRLSLLRRFDQIRQLQIALAHVHAAGEASSEGIPRSVTLLLEELVCRETEAVLDMAKPNAPYSLMIRQEIEAFERELADA